MAAANFEACMKQILKYEGGYSNHPEDPGGVTLEGVIQRVYDAYRKKKLLPPQALVPEMRGTQAWIAERNEIYRTQYWNTISGDTLPKGVDLVVFDGAVNSGVSQSVKWLQRALGLEAADGQMGDITKAAVVTSGDPKKLVANICSRRLAFLQQLKTWPTFKKGWTARVANVQNVGMAMTAGVIVAPKPVPPVIEELGNAKARSQDVSEAPISVGGGTAGTTAGTVTTGVLDPLQTATASLTPFSDAIQIVKYVVIALTLACAGITLYGVYRNYKAKRAQDGKDVAPVPAEGEF